MAAKVQNANWQLISMQTPANLIKQVKPSHNPPPKICLKADSNKNYRPEHEALMLTSGKPNFLQPHHKGVYNWKPGQRQSTQARLLSPSNTPRLASGIEIHYCKQDFSSSRTAAQLDRAVSVTGLLLLFSFIFLNCMTRLCIVLSTIFLFPKDLFSHPKKCVKGRWGSTPFMKKGKTRKTFSYNKYRHSKWLCHAWRGGKKKNQLLFLKFFYHSKITDSMLMERH